MVVSIRVADVEGVGPEARFRPETDEELVRIGGTWDRARKRWKQGARPTQGLVLRVHRGQEAAARWFAEWIRRKRDRDWRGIPRRIWSAALVGGRRSGKTALSLAILVAVAVLEPKSVLWVVSPTLEAGAEVDNALQADMLPRAWYERREAKTGAATTFELANGSRIYLRSGHKVSTLRAGKAALVVLNEAQLQDHGAFVNLRGAVVDSGGLCIVVGNPPSEPRGRWVEKALERCARRTGRRHRVRPRPA
jgi:hypothetical protein